VLEDLGLVNALHALTSSRPADGTAAPAVAFAVDGEPIPLDSELELMLFRVAQEALSNVYRHAGANCVDLHLRFQDGSVQLAVRDDGSVAMIDFRADGTAAFSDSVISESGSEPLQGRWAVIALENNIATVAIYYSVSGLDMHRMNIEIVSKACMNVVEAAFRGMVQKWDQRFVRETAPAARPSKP
jgi:hypothetical protein